MFCPANRDALSELATDAIAGHDRIRQLLERAGMRPTRQRMLIAEHLFGHEHRHVSADALHKEMRSAGAEMSLATIYNTLHRFAEEGLLRKVSAASGRGCFDTDAGNHHHFYIDEEDRVLDIAPGAVSFSSLPSAPDGYEIDKVDVVVHLRPKLEEARSSNGLDGCRNCSGCARRGGCS